MKKLLLSPWLAIFTLFIFLGIRAYDPAFVESVRLRYFDELVTSQPVKSVPVHTVSIDEASLDRYGQYPFPRDIYANIIEELYRRDAGLVVFNVLMPEADRFKQDEKLAQILKQYPVVLPALAGERSKNTDRSSPVTVIGSDPSGRMVEYPGVIHSVDQVGDLAAGVGLVNVFPEVDGVVRRMPLVVIANGRVHASLGLEAARVATGSTNIQVKVSDAGVEAVRIPATGKIATDDISRIWIDWSIQPTEHSLVRLPQSFNGEIVVVGVSAAGINNPVATSRGEVLPHSLQATVLGTVLSGGGIQRPGWADHGELVLLLVLGVAIIAMSRWVYVGIGFFAVTITGVIAGSHYLYGEHRWLLDATAPVVALLVVTLHAYSLKFIIEFLQKQQIRKQFSTYLSPDLVAKLIKDPSLLKLGGEEKELSIMFTDVRGFTSISEHYGRDVQGLTKIMNRYMTAMTRQILANDGTLDKYIGDAQMAFWNAPLDETLHCKDATRAALDMLDDLKTFNDEVTAEGVPAFGMGIGINTGVVVVGNMGSEQRFDYTCLGDSVNLASRLEGQSKNYGVLIVLGPVTAQRLGDEFFTLELDNIAVKGKTEGVDIYTVFRNPSPQKQSEWLSARELHELMLDYYRQQNWDRARDLVKELVGEFDGGMDDYYAIWLERIEDMRVAGLPADWDGTYRATSK